MSNEELVIKIKAGIDVSDNMLALWQQNKSFIHKIAKHYEGFAEIEDLEQESYLALYIAVDGYDVERGCRFLTYAEHWIRQYMLRYIQNNGTTVRLPVHEREKINSYKKIVNSFMVCYGRKPTLHEIAYKMGISDKIAATLEKYAKIEQMGSLDAQMLDGDGDKLGEMLADDIDIEADVIEETYKKQLKAVLWTTVDNLPEEQKKVIYQRFQDGKTLKETGQNMGATLGHVRTLQDKALLSLRRVGELKKMILDEDVYSMGITGNGVARFNTTWTSSTERAAFKRSGF